MSEQAFLAHCRALSPEQKAHFNVWLLERKKTERKKKRAKKVTE